MSMHDTSKRGTIVSVEELEFVFTLITLHSVRSLKGKSLSLRILYTTNTDGKSSAEFHSKTDNKGPLLTIFRTNDGQIGGCYTDEGYQGSNGYKKTDKGALIFKLQDQGGVELRHNFPLLNTNTNYTCSNSSYGPIHGGAHDLCVNGNMAQIRSNNNNNNSYGKDPKGQTLIVPQGTWVPLTCLETFEVVASDSPPVIIDPEPWLRLPSDENVLKRQVTDFQEKFPFPLNVYLIGNAGVGKSSFISSADAAVQGYLTEIARSGKGSGSLTKELMSYSIFSKLLLWDSMGMDGSEGALNKGLNNQIWGGYIKQGALLTDDITPRSQFYRADPGEKHKMHVIVGVLPCSESSNPSALKRLKAVWQQLTQDRTRGSIGFMILLTGSELYDPIVKQKGASYIFRSEKLKKLRQKVSDEVGPPPSQIFPISNYTDEMGCDPEKDKVIFAALKRILEIGNGYFRKLPVDDTTTTLN